MVRASLQTVADQVGLSRATVSRALHRDPRISPESTRRVLAAARELNYRPNLLMSEIASSRWQKAKAAEGSVIAYIDRSRSGVQFGADSQEALLEQSSFLGYRLEIFRREDFQNSTRLQRTLRNRGITDVILGPAYDPRQEVQLDWSKFICVQLTPALYPLPLHSVIKDHFNGVVLAWQKAVSRGYRRIGIVLLDHPTPIVDDVLRSSAAYACQRYFFPDLPALPPFYTAPGEGRVKKFFRWIKANTPDVIIGFSSSHYHSFKSEYGYAAPFISLHVDPSAEISGIQEDAAECAREAVNLLHFCRRTYQWGIPKKRIDHVIEPSWLEGISLPEAAAGGADSRLLHLKHP